MTSEDIEHLDFHPGGVVDRAVAWWLKPIRPFLNTLTEGKCGERPVGQLTADEVIAYAIVFTYAGMTGWAIGCGVANIMGALARAPRPVRTYF